MRDRGRDRPGSCHHPTLESAQKTPVGLSEFFTQWLHTCSRCSKEMAIIRRFSHLARPLLHIWRPHMVPRHKGAGAAVLWSSCSAPFSLILPEPIEKDEEVQASAPTSACSSPLSNISIMMSDPPTNSPFT